MISYERYTEFLSKIIHKTITAPERKAFEEFDSAQPDFCPRCLTDVWTFLEPYRVSHDVGKCAGKAIVRT